MRFLYLIFSVFLLVSLATPGYGHVLKFCPKKIGHCSPKCSKGEIRARSYDCGVHCCMPESWKQK